MVLKESIEEMFPQWPGEDDDQHLSNLIRDLHSGRYVVGDYWSVQRKEKEKEKKKKTKLALVPFQSESERPRKKHKKAAEEDESTEVAKKEDAKGTGPSEDAAAMNTIIATLEKIATKFERYDSVFERFCSQFNSHDSKFVELTQKMEEMEKNFAERVKDAVDERMKVLGLSESAQNYVPSPKTRPGQKSDNSRTVPNTASETPDNDVTDKKTSPKAESRTPQQYFPKQKEEVAKTKEEAAGSKLKAKEEISKGTPEAKKNLFDSELDFITVSPAKQELRRRTRRHPTEKEKAEDAAKKKADAAARRKEITLKKKEEKAAAELKKKEEKEAAELKKKEAAAKKSGKGVIRIQVPPAKPMGKGKGRMEGSTDVEDVTDEVLAKENQLLPESEEEEDERLRLAKIKEYRSRVKLATTGLATNPPSAVFPSVGDNWTTCMRKGFEPSSAIYDPLAPVDPAKLEKLKQHLKQFEAIALTDLNNEEVSFYRILMTDRKHWPDRQFGWLFDTHVASYLRVLTKRSMQDPSPFWSKRIAFIDTWFLQLWVRDFEQFKMNPKMFKFKDSGYENLISGNIPADLPTKKKWLEDVDHLYGVLQTGGDHWVAFHVDLLKEKIDAYDPIIGQVTPESEQKMLEAFRPLLEMIPALINALIPTVCRKKFRLRWKSGKNIPQNTQVGDCGVYSAKFVECLALGVTFDGICDNNIQGIRVKMAAEIFDEKGYDMLAQFS